MTQTIPDHPEVSIIIPMHNAAKYIETCMDSVYQQTYRNFEVIVANDDSTDDSVKLLAKYSNVRLLNVKYRNVSKTRNHAIRESNCEFIAFIDADDKWYPEKLQLQMDIFAKYPEVDVIIADTTKFNDEGKTWITNHLNGISGIMKPEKVLDMLLEWSFINIQSVLVRKSKLFQVDLFDEAYTHCEDHHLWMKVAAVGAIFYYIPQPLAYYRQHEGSLISNKEAIHHFRMRAVESILNQDNLPSLIKRKKNTYLAHHFRRGANLFYNQKKFDVYWDLMHQTAKLDRKVITFRDYRRMLRVAFWGYHKKPVK
jgi:glycosyltransferase involved in cell wall biosynthesis